MTEPTVLAWDTHRAAIFERITVAARQLFVTQGFEATTIEQIVTAAGISRRSFHRYFGSKEDVLLGDLRSRGEAIARALVARPAGEDAWQALGAALLESRAQTLPDTASDLAIGQVMIRTPALRARSLEQRLHWQSLLVPLVSARLTGSAVDLRASAIVASALACIDVAGEAWVAAEGQVDLADLYDQALAALRQ